MIILKMNPEIIFNTNTFDFLNRFLLSFAMIIISIVIIDHIESLVLLLPLFMII